MRPRESARGAPALPLSPTATAAVITLDESLLICSVRSSRHSPHWRRSTLVSPLSAILALAVGVIAGDGLERDDTLDERRAQNREVAEVRADVHEHVGRAQVLLQIPHDVRLPAPTVQEMRHERHIRRRHAELMAVDRDDQIDVAVLREVLDRRHLLL